MTKAERRRAFPKFSATWHRLEDAFERGEREIVIEYSASTYPDLEVAMKAKLWPALYPTFKPGQRLKKRATLALEAAIKPWKNTRRRPTGRTRGRPSHAPVLAALAACDLTTDDGEERLRRIVLAHLTPSNRSERRRILLALDTVIEKHNRRVDWGEFFRKSRKDSAHIDEHCGDE